MRMMDNVEEEKLLEAQVARLRAEVAELKRQQQDCHKDMTFHYSGQMQEALLYVCGRGQGKTKEQVMLKLKEEVKELEDDLKQQTQINGITLDKCMKKTLINSGDKLVQQVSISGHCSDLSCHVNFQLSKVKEGETAKKMITDLNMVMDADNLQNLSSFLSGIEESNDLPLFYRTLRTFSKQCDDRCRTFQHFQQKYPAVVSLLGGCKSEVMTVNHPKLPGCILFLHWTVEVNKAGKVVTQINLFPKIPEKALELCSSEAVRNATESFQSLLMILGPEAAIETVIRAVGQVV